MLAPGVVAAGIGLVMLRVVPPLLGFVARLATPLAGPTTVLVIRRMVRAPAVYARVAVLAMMVAALGTLSATFGSTVEKSLDERAQFQIGADLRLGQISGNQATDGSDLVAAASEAAPGVTAIPVERLGTTVGHGANAAQITILAVDSERMRDGVPLRSDFLVGPPGAFYDAVRGSHSLDPGRKLPGEPRFLAVSLLVDPPEPSSNAWLRLSDASGRYYNVLLGSLGSAVSGGWQLASADLTTAIPDFPGSVSFPLKLQAIFFSNLGQTTTDPEGQILIDGFQVRASENSTWESVEGFEADAPYQLLQTYPQLPDRLESTGDRASEGRRALLFHWVANPVGTPRYIVFSNFNAPAPAAVSEGLMARMGLQVGDQVVVALGLDSVPLKVVAAFRSYPTIDPSTGGIIVELRHLVAAAKLVDAPQRATPNELWLRGGAIDAQAVVDALRAHGYRTLRIDDLAEARDQIAGDPLLAAGTGGLFLLGLGAAILVAVIGIGASVREIVEQRRGEGAILRAMGLHPGQLAASWWFETGSAMLFGAAMGVLLGRLIGGTMLAFLAFDQRGRPVVPAYEVVTDWRVVAVVIVTFVLCAAGAAAALATGARRLRITSELRAVD